MYRVEISNEGGSSFKVGSKDYEFVVDTKANGVTPPAALLAGLGSCMGVYIRKYFEGAGLELGEFSIAVEAEFDKEKPVCFKVINVSVDLKGAQMEERRKEGFLAFIKNCPVHNTLKADPAVEVRII